MKIRRLTALLIALILMLTALPLSASAEVSGDFEYTVNGDGTATLTKYTGAGGHVVIPNTLGGHAVTAIDTAFRYNSNITAVTIPEGVKALKRQAFEGCRGLTDIVVPASVTSIEYQAFMNCTSLKSVSVLGTVAFGNNVFDGDSSLASAGFAGISGAFSSGMFNNCSSLRGFAIPDGATSIGSSAFANCSWLSWVEIPVGVTSIGSSAFSNCSRLAEVEIPAGVTSIGDYAFESCGELSRADLPAGLKTIGGYAFRFSGLTHARIPDGVTSVGAEAFGSCAKMVSLVLPASQPTTIGSYAFAVGVTAPLAKLVIPVAWNNENNLNKYAFAGNYKIYLGYNSPLRDWFNQNFPFSTRISIFADARFRETEREIEVGQSFAPDLDLQIDKSALSWSSSDSAIASVDANGVVSGVSEGVATISMIDQSRTIDTLRVEVAHAPLAGEFEYRMNDDCLTATITAYTGAGGSVVVPEAMGALTVTAIGNYVFEGRDDITGVTLPSGLLKIGRKAFSGASGLNSITIPAGVTEIGERAFENCSGLSGVHIPAAVAGIGEGAFNGCSNLASLSAAADNPAFCAVDDVLFTKNMARIVKCATRKSGAFTVPGTVTVVGSYAFDGCASLTSITFPAGLTALEAYALKGCSGLAKLQFRGAKPTFGSNCFNGASADIVVWYPVKHAASWASYDGAKQACANVTWEHSDGSAALTTLEAVNSGLIAAPADPTRLGYAFDGWFTGPEAEATKWDFATSAVTDDLTLCARWTGIEYTITFLSTGDSATPAMAAPCGSALTPPADPVWADHTFLGWDPAFPATMPYLGLTLTAQWRLGSPTITFVTGGGGAIEPITAAAGTILTAPPDPVWAGHAFGGWDSAFPTAMPARDTTLTAQWTALPYTITFNSNGGGAVDPITADCGSVLTPPEPPTKPGYAFVRWEPALPATMPAGGLTLTAVWGYSITFDSAGGTPVGAIAAEENAALTAPGNPTKAGCTFAGWVPAFPAAMPAGGLTLTATWFPFEYSVNGDGTATITSYSGAGGEVAIPGELGGHAVKAVGANVFSGKTAVTGVSFPASVRSIGSSAFSGCTGLTGIVIPETIESLGTGAFEDCTGLASAVVPGSVSSVPNAAFEDCTSLGSVTLSEGVKTIGRLAFSGCVSLASATIPAGVTSVNVSAFSGCTSLASVSIPAGVTFIGSTAFSGCTALKHVTIPGTAATINTGAFSGCTGLLSAAISEGVTAIGKNMFLGCSSLTTAPIPASVTSIGEGAFSGCASLGRLVLPRSVASIGTSAFADAGYPLYVFAGSFAQTHCAENYLTRTFTIDGAAFLSGSVEVEVGLSVAPELAVDASVDPSTLAWSSSDTGIMTVDESGAVTGVAEGTATLTMTYVGFTDALDECLVTVLPETPGRDFLYSVNGDGLTATITGYVGSGGDVAIPAEIGGYPVTDIGTFAFENKGSITGIFIPSGVVSIGYQAFSGCTSLLSVAIPEGVTSLLEYTFNNCPALMEITLPASLTAIEIGAFSGNAATLYVPHGCFAEGFCLYNHPDRTVVVGTFFDPDQVTVEIGKTAALNLHSYPALSGTVVWASDDGAVASVSGGTVTGNALGRATITAALEGAAEPLASCLVTVAGVEGEFGYSQNADGTTATIISYSGAGGEVAIPATVGGLQVTAIGDGVFAGKGVTGVSIPDGVTSIGAGAFSGCAALTHVAIPSSVR